MGLSGRVALGYLHRYRSPTEPCRPPVWHSRLSRLQRRSSPAQSFRPPVWHSRVELPAKVPLADRALR
eukprot:11776116-Heterocapsa_arctica.AAC.1